MQKRMIRLLTVTLLITFLTGQTLAAPAFPDVKNTDWFYHNVNTLVESGVIKGFPDGTFGPQKPITRAEFTATFLRALGDDVGNSQTGFWADNYIAEALKKGYLKEGEFDDAKLDITRGEMARMIVNALNEQYPANLNEYAGKIKDYDVIPEAFRQYVLKAFYTGIITGRPDGTFGCNDTATRAEAGTMILRLVDKSKRGVPGLAEPTPTPAPSSKPFVSTEVESNPVAKALTEIEGYSSSSYDEKYKYYSIHYGEINQHNKNLRDCVLSVSFPSSDSTSDMVAHIEVIRNIQSNLQRFKHVLEILLPDMKDDIYNLAVERMAWKGEDYYDSFHTNYELYIGHLSSAVFPKEEQGVTIEVIRKR